MPLPRTARLSLAVPTDSRRRNLISLTALIDVVFILLVFFMLASSFLSWRAIGVETPGQGAAGAAMEGALLIEVREDGLRLGGETISLDGVVRKVSEVLARKPDGRILVRPGDGVAVQEVVSVLDRLAGAGIANMSLIREKR